MKLMNGQEAVEEDLMFHIKIAEASKNAVLKSLMMIITPEIVNSFIKLKVCEVDNNEKTIEEHRQIFKHIVDQDPNGAAAAMELHLADLISYTNR